MKMAGDPGSQDPDYEHCSMCYEGGYDACYGYKQVGGVQVGRHFTKKVIIDPPSDDKNKKPEGQKVCEGAKRRMTPKGYYPDLAG